MTATLTQELPIIVYEVYALDFFVTQSKNMLLVHQLEKQNLHKSRCIKLIWLAKINCTNFSTQ